LFAGGQKKHNKQKTQQAYRVFSHRLTAHALFTIQKL